MARIFLLGIVSGFPWVLIGTSLSLWLQEDGFSRSTIGWAGLIFAVYAFNFLWAPLVDRIRVPWLVGAPGAPPRLDRRAAGGDPGLSRPLERPAADRKRCRASSPSASSSPSLRPPRTSPSTPFRIEQFGRTERRVHVCRRRHARSSAGGPDSSSAAWSRWGRPKPSRTQASRTTGSATFLVLGRRWSSSAISACCSCVRKAAASERIAAQAENDDADRRPAQPPRPVRPHRRLARRHRGRPADEFLPPQRLRDRRSRSRLRLPLQDRRGVPGANVSRLLTRRSGSPSRTSHSTPGGWAGSPP